MTQHNQARRTQILTTARRLFATHGFAATTTRELNQEVGIADGLLYYYFPQGKQELLDTIVTSGLKERLTTATVDMHAATTPLALENILMRLFINIWDELTEPCNYQVFVITIRERHLLSADAATWLTQATTALTQNLADQLALVPWLALDATADYQLASICIDLFRNTLYTDFLLADRPQISAATKAHIRGQLHFMIAHTVAVATAE